MLQRLRSDLDETGGKPYGGLMGETSEHHMAHPAELLASRRVQHRMVVTVDSGPPRRHAVNQFARSVRQP